MAQEGDSTFPEVFSMTSLANSVKFLPWCISFSIPLAIWMMCWWLLCNRVKLPQPLQLHPSHRNHLLWGSQAVQLTQLKLLLLSYLLPDIPFEDTPSMWCPFFESLASPLQKKWSHSPSGLFSNCHSKRTQVDSPEVEARSEHSSTWGDDYTWINTRDWTQLWTTKAGIL